jgi:hypothetical protein
MMMKVAVHPVVLDQQTKLKKKIKSHTDQNKSTSTPSSISSDARIRKYWQVTIDP